MAKRTDALPAGRTAAARALLASVVAAAVLAGCTSPHPAPIVHRTPLPAGPAARTPPPLAVASPDSGPPTDVQTAPIRSGAIESRPLDGVPSTASPSARSPSTALRSEPNAIKQPYSDRLLADLKAAAPAAPSASAPAPLASAAPSAAQAGSQTSPTTQTAPKAASDKGFIWPASGAVIQRFNEPSNRGISIAGKRGDPVVAAADGRVIFSGRGPGDYGNLVIIKHDDSDMLSVYAHNKSLLVKEGTNVKRGQRIAELGESGTSQPQLHFEIRKDGKPVDPTQYLPPR